MHVLLCASEPSRLLAFLNSRLTLSKRSSFLSRVAAALQGLPLARPPSQLSPSSSGLLGTTLSVTLPPPATSTTSTQLPALSASGAKEGHFMGARAWLAPPVKTLTEALAGLAPQAVAGIECAPGGKVYIKASATLTQRPLLSVALGSGAPDEYRQAVTYRAGRCVQT